MSQIQKGVAVVWGISSSPVVIGTGSAVVTSQTFGSESDEVEHRNSLGAVVGITTFNRRQTMELTVYPSNTSITNIGTSNILPKAGETVKVIDAADSDVGIAGSPPDGGKEWHVVSATKTKSNEDKMTFNLSLRRYDGITNYAALS
jgi:hypothetical protein